MSILLSVIIPTSRRPLLLARAINSVLNAGVQGDVEVIVVPNGPDQSWQPLAQTLALDPRVRWQYLTQGHACAARNLGLSLARGCYVRFLDDDDTLLPATAAQLADLVATDADLCSGPMLIVDEHGAHSGPAALPATDDYACCALLSIAGCFLAAGTVYRRSLVAGLRWREDVSLYDDYLWSLSVAGLPGLKWRRIETPVACYMQHAGDRLSRLKRTRHNSRHAVEAMQALQAHWRVQGQSSPARALATASALLTLAHSAFPASPIYLSQVIRHAQRLEPLALPRQDVLARHPSIVRHLLVLEWLLLPLRLLSRVGRRAVWWLQCRRAAIRRS